MPCCWAMSTSPATPPVHETRPPGAQTKTDVQLVGERGGPIPAFDWQVDLGLDRPKVPLLVRLSPGKRAEIARTPGRKSGSVAQIWSATHVIAAESTPPLSG